MRCLPLFAALLFAPAIRADPPLAPPLQLALATEREEASAPQPPPTRDEATDEDDREPAPPSTPSARADEELRRSMKSGIPNMVVGGVLMVNGFETALFGFISASGATDGIYRNDVLSARQQRAVGWICVAAGAAMAAIGVPFLVKGKAQRAAYNRAVDPQPVLQVAVPAPQPALAYSVSF